MRKPVDWPGRMHRCNSRFLFGHGTLFYRMPSFDIVSEVNSMELENAVNQAKKELATRFDFKGSKAEIVILP